MRSLCQAVGAEILESIPAKVVTEKLLILVAEEVDDEVFQERIFPHLMKQFELPLRCKVHIPPSVSETNSSPKAFPVHEPIIPIVYFSWLVQSIAADIVAPTSPFSLGVLHL
jgi:hypothetical protein